jgi:4-hydroxybenzoate polyprenyltransferase
MIEHIILAIAILSTICFTIFISLNIRSGHRHRLVSGHYHRLTSRSALIIPLLYWAALLFFLFNPQLSRIHLLWVLPAFTLAGAAIYVFMKHVKYLNEWGKIFKATSCLLFGIFILLITYTILNRYY